MSTCYKGVNCTQEMAEKENLRVISRIVHGLDNMKRLTESLVSKYCGDCVGLSGNLCLANTRSEVVSKLSDGSVVGCEHAAATDNPNFIDY